MRRRVLLCALFAFVLGAASRLATAADPPYPPDIKRIKESGKLRVAQYKGKRPGFFITDNDGLYPGEHEYLYQGNRVVGFDVDLAYRVATELGVKLELLRHYESFDATCRGVASGEADLAITKLSVTYPRSQYIRYAQPYLRLRMGVLINRVQESRTKRGPDPFDLCNHPEAKVGVIENTSFVVHGRNTFPKAELVMFPNQEALFKGVQTGAVLAILYEEFEINRFMRLYPDLPIFARAEYLAGKEDHIAVAVGPQSPTLLGFLNQFLEREQIHPTVRQILEDYFPEGALDGESQMESKETLAAALNDPNMYGLAGALAVLVGAWVVLARRKSKAPSTAPAASDKETAA